MAVTPGSGFGAARTPRTTTGEATVANAVGTAALPFTGSDTRLLLAVASALLLGGSVLLCRASVLDQRRRSS
jgi:hypothetical protein